MIATYLGSAGLTILIRCPCGYRNFFDRPRLDLYGFARCDNCLKEICKNLTVRTHRRGGFSVDELKYEETEERRRILGELLEIKAKAVRLAESVTVQGVQHRVRNVAMSAAAQRSLLEQDWHFEDKEKGA